METNVNVEQVQTEIVAEVKAGAVRAFGMDIGRKVIEGGAEALGLVLVPVTGAEYAIEGVYEGVEMYTRIEVTVPKWTETTTDKNGKVIKQYDPHALRDDYEAEQAIKLAEKESRKAAAAAKKKAEAAAKALLPKAKPGRKPKAKDAEPVTE